MFSGKARRFFQKKLPHRRTLPYGSRINYVKDISEYPVTAKYCQIPINDKISSKSYQLLRNAARFLSLESRIRLRIRRLVGVTSRSSSWSMNSMACSRLKILGGTSFRASSAEEERVLVRCFVLQTFRYPQPFRSVR